MDYTKIYDESLLEIGGDEQPDGSCTDGYYTHFKQMLPWIGVDYGNGTFKKIILIGESHYLPKNVSEELFNPNNWYHENHKEWYEDGDDEEQMTNTRQFLSGYIKPHRMYNYPHNVLREVIMERSPELVCENLYRYIAYYNYFLRPARNKGSIQKIIKLKDLNIASDTLIELAAILKPDYVFFLSKFAWESFISKRTNESLPFIVGYSDHPSRRWNIANNYNGTWMTSKESFKQFLLKNGVFEKQ
jgi:hypothetical protein